MTVTTDDLATYCNTSPDEPVLPDILATATELIGAYLGANGVTACPTRTYDLAVLTLGSELYARRNSPGGGVAQWGPDGQPVRLARDPMVSVKPLLLPYKGLGVVA